MLEIAVTGASGQLGRRVLQHLAASGRDDLRVVACSRQPAHLAGLPCHAVRHADFADTASLEAAFAGVERLLIVSIEGDDAMRVQAHARAAQAARRAGVQRIVYTSFFDVDPASPSIVARVHRESEAAIHHTGCDSVMLRNGPYAENMLLRAATAAREGGLFQMPGGNARLPFIGRDDLAAAAAAALLRPMTGQAVWRLSGAELLDFAALCAMVGQAIGMPVHYRPMSDAQYLAELAAQGLPALLQQRRLAYTQAMRAGFMTALTDDFLQLVGRPPEPLGSLLQRMDLSAGQALH